MVVDMMAANDRNAATVSSSCRPGDVGPCGRTIPNAPLLTPTALDGRGLSHIPPLYETPPATMVVDVMAANDCNAAPVSSSCRPGDVGPCGGVILNAPLPPPTRAAIEEFAPATANPAAPKMMSIAMTEASATASNDRRFRGLADALRSNKYAIKRQAETSSAIQNQLTVLSGQVQALFKHLHVGSAIPSVTAPGGNISSSVAPPVVTPSSAYAAADAALEAAPRLTTVALTEAVSDSLADATADVATSTTLVAMTAAMSDKPSEASDSDSESDDDDLRATIHRNNDAINRRFDGLRVTLGRNKIAIVRQEKECLAVQSQLIVVQNHLAALAGQLNGLLMHPTVISNASSAVASLPAVTGQRRARLWNPNASPAVASPQAVTGQRRARLRNPNVGLTAASASYIISTVNLSCGDKCFWKAESGCLVPSIVLSSVPTERIGDLLYTIVHSTVLIVEMVKHSDLLIDPTTMCSRRPSQRL